MKPLRPRRARCVEPLEPRQLLAGTVHVEFVGEDLVLTGDEQANGFAVVGDGEPGRQAGSFLIVPDESTSINGQPPGEPLEIQGRVVNVRILPGEGEDGVRVSDLAIRGGLTIESSSGADRYSIEDSAVGGLRLNSGGPIDVCKVPAPPAPVFQPFISVDGVTVNGSAHIESDECGGSVRLGDLDVNGTLDIVSAGPTDVTLESSKVARGGHVKWDPILREADGTGGGGGGGTVAIVDSRFGGGLTVESAGDPIDGKILRTRVEGGVLKFHSTGEAAASRLAIADSRLDGGLDVSIEGEGPQVQMDGLAVSGGESSRVHLSKRIDKSSPILAQVRVQDSSFNEGLDVLVLGLHPADKSTPILMRQSSFGEGLSVESDQPLDLTLDTVRSASVDVFIKLPDVTGEASAVGDGSVRVLNSRLDGLDVTVEGDSSPDLTIEDTHVRKRPGRVKYGDITLKRGVIDKSTPILMKRSSFEEGLEIESDRPLDLTAEDVRSASLGVFVKLPDVPGEARGGGGRIAILSSRVDGELTVESNAPLDVSMQSSRAGAAYLKLDGIKGEALSDGTLSTGGSHVLLWDSAVDGNLRVSAGAGDEQLQLDRVRVRGQTQIDLGGGDDRLQIVDSVFREFASLDGGDGHDLLSLENARFRGGFELFNWEGMTGSPRAPRSAGRF